MPRAATVVDGMRGPTSRADLAPDGKNVTVPDYIAAKAAARKAKEPAFKPRAFMSRFAGLIVQLDAPADIVDTRTGKVSAARPRKAKFVDHIYVCTTQEDYDALLAHPNYGMGVSFWLQEEAAEAAKEKQYADAKKLLEVSPELKNRLLQDLAGDTFPVDKKPQPEAAV